MEYSVENEKDLSFRKASGRAYLSNNRLSEAIEIYAGLIRDYPRDIEAFLVLGDLYLAAENSTAALHIYKKARLIDPENCEITSRIELAESEQARFGSNTNDLALDSEHLVDLYQKLSGKPKKIQENEIQKAEWLLEEIIHSTHPAELVAANLDKIDTLLPALLEINIRQAKAESRIDLVESLESIQASIPGSGGENLSGQAVSSTPEDWTKISPVVILVPDKEMPSVRVQYIQESISAIGLKVHLAQSSEEARGYHPAIVIASNPHTNPWLLEYMAECTAHSLPVILDLDADYEQMPLNHPEYVSKGLGLPVNARAYAAALLLSNLVTTSTHRFTEQLQRSGYNAITIPDGWSKSNNLWEKKPSDRPVINIGWLGGSGMLDDILDIRRILIRVIREFPKAQLVICEDQKAFHLFESLPENRKMFLPEVSPEDYPFVLSQLDILVVPLRNLPYNFSLPDTIFMQAGIKRIPWVASRLPSASEWEAGGLLASSQEEWHTNLRQLLLDDEIRLRLGSDGYEKAKTREINLMKEHWKSSLFKAISEPQNRGFVSKHSIQPIGEGQQ